MKTSTAHYTTTQVKQKGERIANRPEDDDLVSISFPRPAVEVNQTLPETIEDIHQSISCSKLKNDTLYSPLHHHPSEQS
jgi:hypothetical protein